MRNSIIVFIVAIFISSLVVCGCGHKDNSGPEPLTITTSSLPDGAIGIPYTAMLLASGGKEPYKWELLSGSLPSGLDILDNGTIAGAPTAEGDFTFTVQVTDKTDKTAKKQFTVKILPAGSLLITTVSLPDGETGESYTATLTANGGTIPYIWSIVGTLPDGIKLDTGTGEISGTPTTEGNSKFTVQVTDAQSATATKDLSITITDGVSQPVISVTPADIDFGTVEVGGIKESSFTVENAGEGELTGSATSLSAPFSFVGDTSYNLTAGETSVIIVSFAPTDAGSFSGAVTFTGAAGAVRDIKGVGELLPTIYVDDANGSDENGDGTRDNPYKTIQKGLDEVSDGYRVVVADGEYTGERNKNLDFTGKAITLKSKNGPQNCIIDCQNSGGGFYFHSGEGRDSIVLGFTIRNGNTNYGAAIHCKDSSPTISSNAIVNNSATAQGGAIGCFGSVGSNPEIINNIIANNSSCLGGAIFCFNSTLAITNNTIVNNRAITTGGTPGTGGGICGIDANPIITNTILWDNSAPVGNQIYVITGTPYVTYSDIQGGWLGDGNIDLAPKFIGSSDYHLQVDSPCIDTGDNSLVDWDYDMDGKPRIVNDVVDMGAYEKQ